MSLTPRQALQHLGASPDMLAPGERAFLDQHGYLPLGKVLPDEVVEKIGRRLNQLAQTEGDSAGSELHQEPGASRLANLLDKDPLFEAFITSPRVLAGITHVLGPDIQLSSLSSRSALPGEGEQDFHADWHEPADPDHFMVCNAAWLISDMSAENGGTRIIPGSHLRQELPQHVLGDRAEDQPGQINMTGTSGSVIIFNSHIWHAGATNDSDRPRTIVLSYFTRCGSEYIQNDHRELLSDRTKKTLSAEALALAAAT
jgi:hypothetical protein